MMSASSIFQTHRSNISHQSHELAPSDSTSFRLRQHQTLLIHSPTICTVPTITSTNNSTNSVIGTCAASSKDTNTVTSGATIFVQDNVPDVIVCASTSNIIPGIQSMNSEQISTVGAIAVKNDLVCDKNCNLEKSAQVVKIQINPKIDNNTNKVISTVRLNLENSSENSFQINGKKIDNCNTAVYVDSNNGINDNYINTMKYSIHNNTVFMDFNSKNIDINSKPCVKISMKCDSDSDFSDSKEISKELLDHISINTKNEKDKQIIQKCTLSEPLNSCNSCKSYFYYRNSLNMMVISSGQNSPSETLDNSTYKDLNIKLSVLSKKHFSNTFIMRPNTNMLNCDNYHHSQVCNNLSENSLSNGDELDSDDNENNVSCDSLNGRKLMLSDKLKFRVSKNLELRTAKQHQVNKENLLKNKKDTIYSIISINDIMSSNRRLNNTECIDLKEKCLNCNKSSKIFPLSSGILMLSQNSSKPTVESFSNSVSTRIVNRCTYEECKHNSQSNNQFIVSSDDLETKNCSISNRAYEHDRYYKFHINERDEQINIKSNNNKLKIMENDEECFAGYKIFDKEAIRSAKGTVRGVKNRVRAGIATFLQKPSSKNYKAKDAGKVVIYTTTMGIVRQTYYRCVLVKQILKTHMIKYEERDMYMSLESQSELRDRIGCITIQVPQLFIDGQYIGDADIVERLNESGELRLMLKPYKSLDTGNTCKICGGYCLLPCPICNGSKKSVHRNDFTTEFIALKCMNCNEVGLVRCQHC